MRTILKIKKFPSKLKIILSNDESFNITLGDLESGKYRKVNCDKPDLLSDLPEKDQKKIFDAIRTRFGDLYTNEFIGNS